MIRDTLIKKGAIDVFDRFNRRTMGSHKATVRGDENIQMVNAVLYINRTGCQWRNLPNDFPPYKTVFSFYSRACKKGLWDEILVLLVDESRKQAGRKPSPTYGIVDSQSVKTVYHSNNRGIDGGKKNQGT